MKINVDFGWRSVNHFGEEVCGDRVDFRRQGNRFLAVLADGMGSGVKANILSTMGSTILRTMLLGGETVDSAVNTVIHTLPVCSERGMNYCTFSVVDIDSEGIARVVEFDNPQAWIIRNGELYNPERTCRIIDEKAVWERNLPLVEGDLILITSDGCVNAGAGNSFSYTWTWDSVAKWLEAQSGRYTSSRRLASDFIEAVVNIYQGRPDDDVTAMVIRVVSEQPVSIMYGPPAYKEDDSFMVKEFMEAEGMKILCGGSTSAVVARELNRESYTMAETAADGIPPIAFMDGMELVTEGVITMTRAAEIIEDYYQNRTNDFSLLDAENGAAILAKILVEQSTSVQFFVGKAANEAYDGKNIKLSLDRKIQAVERICKQLEEHGKDVSIFYY